MTDKEFKKLKRSELIAIIYEYQKKQEALESEIETLREQLKAKEVKISSAGSIAEAVIGLNDIFGVAQQTADDYLENAKAAAERKAAEIIEEAEKRAGWILADAGADSDGSENEITEDSRTDTTIGNETENSTDNKEIK